MSTSGPAPRRAMPLLPSQRAVVVGALVAVTAVCWAYLASLARGMSSLMPSGAMRAPGVAWVLTMWVVMMVAMMLPTAAPMILTHARFQRGQAPARSPAPFTGLFALGYVAAWTGYAVLAAAAQVLLQRSAAMHAMSMALASPAAAAGVLIAAGAFQLAPLKNACLRQCRSPIGFFMTSWRDGRGGALRMGVDHGTSCVGCCWAIMAILFVVGTMNLAWAAALTIFALLEKVVPKPKLVTWGSGVALIVAGVATYVVHRT